MSLPVVALLIAAANLFALAAYTRARRRFRQQAWMSEPRRLTETEPGPPVLAGCGIVAGLAAFVLAATEPTQVVVPIAASFSAPAVLGWAHIWKWRSAAALGMLMTMLVPVAMFVAWGQGAPLGLLPGLLFGSAWMLWLAGFWRQQLAPEGPWTTSGVLIPVARWCGAIGAACAIGAAVVIATHNECPSVAWWVWTALGGLFFARAIVMNLQRHVVGRAHHASAPAI